MAASEGSVRLNPIQGVASPNVARASRFTAYESHASHILRGGPHKSHRSHGVSCSFLHDFLQPMTPERVPGCSPSLPIPFLTTAQKGGLNPGILSLPVGGGSRRRMQEVAVISPQFVHGIRPEGFLEVDAARLLLVLARFARCEPGGIPRKVKGCRNWLLRQPLRCRGDW